MKYYIVDLLGEEREVSKSYYYKFLSIIWAFCIVGGLMLTAQLVFILWLGDLL